MREAIAHHHLRAPVEDVPTVMLWIHGWTKQAYEGPATVELDWTSYFQRSSREIPTESEWDTLLFAQLDDARKKLAALPGGRYIDLRGNLSPSAMLAMGTFPAVARYRFRVEQPTREETFLWRSDASPSKKQLQGVDARVAEEGEESPRGLLDHGRRDA